MAMPATLATPTPAEYLALERKAEIKSEYIDGAIVAMSGGSRDHSRLKLQLARLVGNQVADGDCEAFDSDLRVRVDPTRYTYPDLTVVCGESRFEDAEMDTLLNPTVVFEVLSPSTEAHDRGEKWGRYRRMPSLRQYVLVSQTEPVVEVFTRSGDLWTFRDAAGMDGALHLEAIGVTLPLGELYSRVEFGEAASGASGDLEPDG